MENYFDLAREIVGELDEERLIHAVKKWKCLYASNDPDFQNLALHRTAWNEIANQCNKKVADCVNHWYTLLQTYFSTGKDSNWAHLKLLREFEPHLSNSIPTRAQREELTKELLNHSEKLRSPEATMEHRQIIWSIVVSKCNGIKNGTFLPIIRWQKFWYSLKQHFGIQWSNFHTRLQALGTKLDVAKYSAEEQRIIRICGASPSDSFHDIISAIFSNIELGTDKEHVVPKCTNCNQHKNELLIDGICESCRKRPGSKCDMCKLSHGEEGLLVYRVSKWTDEAKTLLPQDLINSDDIFLCLSCSNNLQKKCTLAWKICRICETNHTNLDYIFSTGNNYLRRIFKEASTIALNETDGLPGYLCAVCKVQVQQFNNFYLKTSRAQGRLRTLHATSFIGPIVRKMGSFCKVNQNSRFKNKNMVPVPESNIKTIQTPGSIAFKRVYVKKSNPQAATTKVLVEEPKRKIPPSSTSKITIKDIFSLKEGSVVTAPTPAPAAKSDESVVPPALQSGTVNNVFSNNDVTITRRVIPTSTTDKLPNIANIHHNKIDPIGSIASNAGLTISKRVGPAPINTQGQQYFSNESDIIFNKTATGSTLPLTNIKEAARLPGRNIQPTAHTTSSKPAIFTIPGTDFDYETVEDAPPVFCIPKNPDRCLAIDNTKPFNFNDVLTKTTPENNAPIIKTERIDPEYPSIEPDVNPVQVSEHIQPIQPNQPIQLNQPNQPIQPIPNPVVSSTNLNKSLSPNTKMIRLNGSRVLVKPHPYISGGYVKVGSSNQTQPQPSTQPVNSVNLGKFPTYIRKIGDPQQKSQNNSVVMTSEQQHRIQQQHQGIKKARKYWGTVDEFQISQQQPTQPAKNLTMTVPAEPVPVSMQRNQMTPVVLPQWSATNTLNDNLTDPLRTPSVDDPTTVKIKQELPDKDDEEPIEIIPQKNTNETNPSMFYPDSFELENVTLSADVSLMIDSLICRNDSIIENNMSLGGGTLNTYLNPSFLFPYATNQQTKKPEYKKDDKKNEEKTFNRTQEEIANKQDKISYADTEVVNGIKIPQNTKLKKLRIKLRRNSRVQALISRPRRSCTSKSSGLRKSLRNTNNK